MMPPDVNTDPFSGLFDRWAGLTGWIRAAAALPTNASAFRDRYGHFDDDAEVERFVAAVAGVAALARRAGSPSALIAALAENPGLLQAEMPPDSLYGNLVWLAQRVSSVAQTAALTLDAIPPLLSPATGDASARADALKGVLAGPGGLVEGFGQVRRQAEALATALTGFDSIVTASAAAVAGSTLVNQANTIIGGLEAEHRHLAATATTVSAGSSADRIAAIQAEIARKQALVDDSAPLLAGGDRVLSSVPAVGAAVADVALRFQRAAGQLLQFCAISSVAQLSDATWTSQALDLPILQAGWRSLATSADTFVRNAFAQSKGDVS